MRGLLFLDFDGVLNRITPTGYQPPHPGLDTGCVAEVAACADRHDLGVVVSSSWRENYSLEVFIGMFAHLSLGQRFIGVTPIHADEVFRRSREVEAWLQENNQRGLPHVIVDDSKKHGFEPKRFVRTKGALGFTAVDALAVAAILERQGA